MGLMKRVLTETPPSDSPTAKPAAAGRTVARGPRPTASDGDATAAESARAASRGVATAPPTPPEQPIRTATTGMLPARNAGAGQADPDELLIEPEIATNMILRELQSLPATIEAPAHVFGVLKRNLGIKKGALLLPDPDERLFVPWTVTGFDLTTQRHLHIPEIDAKAFFPQFPFRLQYFSADALPRVRRYFSNREFSVLETVVLAPFCYDDRLLAILCIADTPFFRLDRAILSVVFSAFEKPVSELLYRCRDQRIARIQLPLLFSMDQLVPMANEAVSELPGKEPHLLFFVFDPASAVEAIGRFTQDTDTYRIRQDFLRILNTLLAGLGRVFITPDNRMILMFAESVDETNHLDVELLIHQITNRMREVFGREAMSDQIQYRIAHFPEDTTDLEALAGTL